MAVPQHLLHAQRPPVVVQSLVSLRAFTASTPSHRHADGRPSHTQHRRLVQANSSADQKIVQEIAQLMPDPGGSDNLLAEEPEPMYSGGGAADSPWDFDGNPSSEKLNDVYNEMWAERDLYSSAASPYRDAVSEEERLARMTPEQRFQEEYYLEEQRLRQEWEIEQAQERAMELHHEHMETSDNRYKMALAIGDIMERLEDDDYYAADGQDRVPSWIRAHFVMAQQIEQERMMEDPDRMREMLTHAGGQRSPVEEDGSERLGSADILPGADDDLSVDAFLADFVGAELEEAQPIGPQPLADLEDEAAEAELVGDDGVADDEEYEDGGLPDAEGEPMF